MPAYIAESHADVTALELKVNPAFRDLLPPLTEEQTRDLNQSVEKSGVYQPLVGWCDGQDWWLVDGHNRREALMNALQSKPSMIEPDVLQLVADSEEEVMAWIIQEHITRRNLTPNQLSELRGRTYNKAKKNREDNLKSPNGQIVHSGKTSEKTTSEAVAENFGVNEKTVRRDGDFAKGVEEIEKEDPQEAAKIRQGKSKKTKAEVEALGRGESKPTAEPKAKLDPSKRPIPEEMEDVFSAGSEFNSLSRELDAVLKRAQEHCPQDEDRTQGFEHLRIQEFIKHIKSAKAELKFAKPYTTCVEAIHKGPDCPLCRGVGFLVRDTLGRLSDIDKANLPQEVK